MNIFHTHQCPRVAAQSLCDKHIPKMTLETMQMICTAHHEAGHAPAPLYRAAYVNHPMTKWVRENISNYLWTLEHMMALGSEYELRFGKKHASMAIVPWLPSDPKLPQGELSEPPQCMPDEYKDADYITAYRNYYMGDKRRFAKWQKGRGAPHWFA